MRRLGFERRGCSAVVDHVVGSSETLLARGLRGKDGLHFLLREAASPHGALDLLRLGAIDHEHPGVARSVDAALHQERDHENCVGAPRARAPGRAVHAYQLLPPNPLRRPPALKKKKNTTKNPTHQTNLCPVMLWEK